MSTRLEKIAESLKREQHRQDIKRLKRAKEYFDYGLAMLRDDFHNQDYTNSANQIVVAVNEELVYIRDVIEEA